MLKPVNLGWAVTLTDGRELRRFIGLGAKRRALRYLSSRTGDLRASRARRHG
jgi:hypothetical protein